MGKEVVVVVKRTEENNADVGEMLKSSPIRFTIPLLKTTIGSSSFAPNQTVPMILILKLKDFAISTSVVMERKAVERKRQPHEDIHNI